jgi:hypothetical protein
MDLRSWQRLIGLVAVVSLAAGVGAFVGHRDPGPSVVFPSSLGGLAPTTDPQLLAQASALQAVWAKSSDSGRVAFRAYGAALPSTQAIVVVVPIGRPVGPTVFGVSVTESAQFAVLGPDACTGSNGVTICARSSSTRTMIVAVFGGTGNPQAASMLDQAWRAQ